ncbi:MAG: zinc ribbon domain-containing protein [Ruminococcus sp.]|nr:zinc ribbon domain-containing protein [Ruminococcus sp.]
MGFLDQVKDLAGKVGNTVEKGAKSISDGSKKMAEKSKLKSEISQLESATNTAYIVIGKAYFEEAVSNSDPDCINAVETVTKNVPRLEQLRRQLDALDDKVSCQNCGASLFKDQKFCDKCGAKVEIKIEPIVTPEESQNIKVCPKCNTPVSESGQKFCEKCGTDLYATVIEPAPVETEAETEKSAEIPVCSECGSPLESDGQLFCKVCGKKL